MPEILDIQVSILINMLIDRLSLRALQSFDLLALFIIELNSFLFSIRPVVSACDHYLFFAKQSKLRGHRNYAWAEDWWALHSHRLMLISGCPSSQSLVSRDQSPFCIHELILDNYRLIPKRISWIRMPYCSYLLRYF